MIIYWATVLQLSITRVTWLDYSHEDRWTSEMVAALQEAEVIKPVNIYAQKVLLLPLPEVEAVMELSVFMNTASLDAQMLQSTALASLPCTAYGA